MYGIMLARGQLPRATLRPLSYSTARRFWTPSTRPPESPISESENTTSNNQPDSVPNKTSTSSNNTLSLDAIDSVTRSFIHGIVNRRLEVYERAFAEIHRELETLKENHRKNKEKIYDLKIQVKVLERELDRIEKTKPAPVTTHPYPPTIQYAPSTPHHPEPPKTPLAVRLREVRDELAAVLGHMKPNGQPPTKNVLNELIMCGAAVKMLPPQSQSPKEEERKNTKVKRVDEQEEENEDQSGETTVLDIPEPKDIKRVGEITTKEPEKPKLTRKQLRRQLEMEREAEKKRLRREKAEAKLMAIQAKKEARAKAAQERKENQEAKKMKAEEQGEEKKKDGVEVGQEIESGQGDAFKKLMEESASPPTTTLEGISNNIPDESYVLFTLSPETAKTSTSAALESDNSASSSSKGATKKKKSPAPSSSSSATEENKTSSSKGTTETPDTAVKEPTSAKDSKTPSSASSSKDTTETPDAAGKEPPRAKDSKTPSSKGAKDIPKAAKKKESSSPTKSTSAEDNKISSSSSSIPDLPAAAEKKEPPSSTTSSTTSPVGKTAPPATPASSGTLGSIFGAIRRSIGL